MIGDRRHARRAGFTLVEIMVVLVIIGLLATLTAALTRGKLDESKVMAAASQMNSIKKAVVDGFYRDFGYIPEEVHRYGVDSRVGSLEGEADTLRNQNPEYATRFLCLERDCTNGEIADVFSVFSTGQLPSLQVEAQKWGGDDGRLGCAFMTRALHEMRDNALSSFLNTYMYSLRYLVMTDPSVGRRGWTGPYLACNGRIDATALHRTDADQYPAIFYSDPGLQIGPYAVEAVTKDVYFPVITTPWADDLEATARQAEADKDPDLAKELRKGRYYQMLVYSRLKYWLEENTSGTYYLDTVSPAAQVPETAVIISRGADGRPGTAGDASTVGAEDYWMKCAKISQYGLTDEQRACFRRLAITDPNDPDYVNIGDDMVLFIFGDGPVRSPLEK